MKINSLTQEQINKFPEYIVKWLKIGLDTKPLNKQLIEKELKDVYEIAGLTAPKIFIYLPSPIQGCIAAEMLSNKKFSGAQVRDQVRDQVGAQVRAQVRDQVWAQVGAQVRDQVWDQVGAQVRDQVWVQVRAQVRDQVGAQVRDQVWDQVGAQVYKAGYGLQDSGWLSYYDFFQKECHLLEETKKIIPLINLSEQCGWWWPFSNLVIIIEKPTKISMIEEKLHNIGGPSVEYSDGFCIYSLNGKLATKEEKINIIKNQMFKDRFHKIIKTG